MASYIPKKNIRRLYQILGKISPKFASDLPIGMADIDTSFDDTGSVVCIKIAMPGYTP